jgi:hypothetical protein
MHWAAAAGIRRTLTALTAILDTAESSSRRPFDEPAIMVPNVNSKRFGWTHYGVMIPDLPERHRFFSVMSLIGATGSLAFDTDDALVDRPRRNASVVVGTAWRALSPTSTHAAEFTIGARGRLPSSDCVSGPPLTVRVAGAARMAKEPVAGR